MRLLICKKGVVACGAQNWWWGSNAYDLYLGTVPGLAENTLAPKRLQVDRKGYNNNPSTVEPPSFSNMQWPL